MWCIMVMRLTVRVVYYGGKISCVKTASKKSAG